jgi:hypothetical protein
MLQSQEITDIDLVANPDNGPVYLKSLSRSFLSLNRLLLKISNSFGTSSMIAAEDMTMLLSDSSRNCAKNPFTVS